MSRNRSQPRRFGEVKVIRAEEWDAKKIREYEQACDLADYVILDCGPSAGKAQQAALDASDFVVIVHDDQWGARDAATMYRKVVSTLGKPYLIVANKVAPGKAGIPEVPGLEASLRRGETGPLASWAELLLGHIDDAGARVVAVIGGKGGVGKSTVAMLIASRIKEANGKVIVLDLDAQAASILGVLRGDRDGEHRISDRKRNDGLGGVFGEEKS
jgi:cellulose biosynthesis protein BcsQ